MYFVEIELFVGFIVDDVWNLVWYFFLVGDGGDCVVVYFVRYFCKVKGVRLLELGFVKYVVGLYDNGVNLW